MARDHSLTVAFDRFGWEELTAEARRQGVAIEELVAHAAMYYLADLDSGRLATRVMREADQVEPARIKVPLSRFRRRPASGSWS